MTPEGCFLDLARTARRRLPRLFSDYIDGGAHGERSLTRNRDAFSAWAVIPRAPRNVAALDLRADCFGQAWSLPLMLAPVGFAGMFHPAGEVAACRAAAEAGVGMALSTFAVDPLEKLVAAGMGAPFVQLYVLKDRAVTRDMLARAAACGAPGIVVTVDTPVTPVRERDVRNGFRHLSRPTLRQWAGLAGRPRWALGMALGAIRRGRPQVGNILPYTRARGVMAQARDVAARIDPAFSPRDLAWLRDAWPGRLIVKGIMHPDDALACVAAGVDGLIISNHGGRQMDPSPAPLDVLPAIADAVGGAGVGGRRVDLVLDGGIRRGGDVVTALALGADAVAIGRPWAWGLAAAGEQGVASVIGRLATEIADVMALAGLTDLAALRAAGRGALWHLPTGDGRLGG